MFFSPRSLVQTAAVLPCLFTFAAAQNACNNSPSLCSRAYNNITHLGAHDSPFLRNKATSFSTSGNQYYNTTVQLDAGVRLVTAQVHKVNGTGTEQWHLCHSSCDLLDAGTLANWLGEIKDWMDDNPHDVVTVLLVNSDNATPAELGAQFQSADIEKYAYKPASTSIPKTWPTLDQLISNNTRLMTFVASISQPSTQYSYLMDEFTYIFENNYDNTSPSNYSCNPNRPTSLSSPSAALSSGRMFLMNHFLYESNAFFESPNATYAPTTNGETGLGSLGTAMTSCKGVYGKPPTFVLVDFFNVGPAIASVDTANGISSPTGRLSVSTAALTESSSAAGRREASLSALVAVLVVALFVGM